MKIAVVHDYFTQSGGAERVAEEIACIFPSAPVFAAVTLPERIPSRLKDRKFFTSWMQRLPFMRQLHRLYFAFYPLGVESLDLKDYDLIVSSSSGYGKGVHIRPGAVHVCYCHTPMRWAWEYGNYSARERHGQFIQALLKPAISMLRWWDFRAAQRPTYFLANSENVAEKIRAIYRRDAVVLHPPIDIHRFRPADEHEDYYLILARLVSYKRIDLAVEACTKLGRKLLVIGEGPDRKRLEEMAGPTIKFLGRLPDADVERYASRCRALIFPGEEDFGMAPLEIASAGRPTIAYRAGGALETIVEGVTGVFFDTQDAASVMDAIVHFEELNWDSEVLRKHASKFGVEAFQEELLRFLAQVGMPYEQSRANETTAMPQLTRAVS
ncbi:glycosyltransferase family 4 protein [Silvibacterium dinghuense]|uniref:Glycosyltransferase family 4 protein n=2 Tax=Silvibacterium dinghuense TaxID=1560006 RepID=A0A4Q1SEK3_9BACT|nr:glycosyltransferase family 4 protein [Silvibacterium dinghuense]GGH09314.1 glycosyl transferase [Silvibacterium dinghuense]